MYHPYLMRFLPMIIYSEPDSFDDSGGWKNVFGRSVLLTKVVKRPPTPFIQAPNEVPHDPPITGVIVPDLPGEYPVKIEDLVKQGSS